MQEYWGMLIGEIRHVCTVQIHDTLGLCSGQTTAINAYFVMQHIIYVFNSMNNVLDTSLYFIRIGVELMCCRAIMRCDQCEINGKFWNWSFCIGNRASYFEVLWCIGPRRGEVEVLMFPDLGVQYIQWSLVMKLLHLKSSIYIFWITLKFLVKIYSRHLAKLWNFFSQEGAVFILYKLLGCFVEYLIGYLGTN